MNPFTLLPQRLRTGMYVLLGLLGPAVPYALDKGWIGTAEVTMYGSYCAICGITAASNPTYRGKHRA